MANEVINGVHCVRDGADVGFHYLQWCFMVSGSRALETRKGGRVGWIRCVCVW